MDVESQDSNCWIPSWIFCAKTSSFKIRITIYECKTHREKLKIKKKPYSFKTYIVCIYLLCTSNNCIITLQTLSFSGCLCPVRQNLCRPKAEPSPAHLRHCVLPEPGKLAQPERKCPHRVNQCTAKDNGIPAPAAVACPSPQHLSTRVDRAGPGQQLRSATTLLISTSRCLGAPHTAK